MKDPYTILGVKRDASDDEIKRAYRALVRKYHPDNYADDNPLKELATEKMQEVNEAYDEIQRLRQSGGSSQTNSGYNYGGSTYGPYAAIRNSLNAHRFAEAERALMAIAESERVAEWHYLYSVVLMRKGRVNDAMRELEAACSMDPSNQEYQNAKQMFNSGGNNYGSMYYGNSGNYRRAGNSADDACNCCINLMWLDCCCECMGGDLIPCI